MDVKPMRYVSRLVGAPRRERESLPGDGGCVHESALCYGEYRHTLLIDARRSRVLLAAACSGRSAARARARGSARGDRDRARAGGKLERTRFEFIQSAFVLEKNDLAIGFAAGLESDADLAHGRIADVASAHIDTAFAECSAHAETSFTDRREYGIRIAPVEERGAFAGISEQINGIGVVVGVSH